MRAALRHPIAERRSKRTPSRLRVIARRGSGSRDRARAGDRSGEKALDTIAALRAAEEAAPIVASRACEEEVARVRAAGGPLDRAVYTCSCGYCFDACVSTSVPCPHCGATQAW